MKEFPLNTIQSAKILKELLLPLYDAREAQSLSRLLVEYVSKKEYLNFLLNSDILFSESQLLLFSNCAERLLKGEPIQHVIRRAHFYGLEFNVSSEVLIPRGETESLIEWILSDLPAGSNPFILEIGTGSGCIPITLSNEASLSNVIATDVSIEALKIAKENSEVLGVDIDFRRHDILNWSENDFNDFDIIVSNPPYILKNESNSLHINVLEFEPHLALFTPNEVPLLFYSKIAAAGVHWLKAGGLMYFEINEALGKEVCDLLAKNGYHSIELRKDIHGKDRMVKGIFG